MSESQLTEYFGRAIVGRLDVGTGGVVLLNTGTVTQITTLATAVTLNTMSGVITTVSSTMATATAATFTVNNSNVSSTSRVTATVTNYSGTYVTNGIPVIAVNNVTSGAFDVVVTNAGANSLGGILKISFNVWN